MSDKAVLWIAVGIGGVLILIALTSVLLRVLPTSSIEDRAEAYTAPSGGVFGLNLFGSSYGLIAESL